MKIPIARAFPAGFRIRITPSGYLFIFLCLGVGASALNTGNNLLYLVFAMMLAFLLLSGILSNNTLRRLVIEPTFPARIFAGQDIPVPIRLTNRKRLFPSFAVTITPEKVVRGAKTSGALVLKIPPGESASTIGHITFPHRGRQVLPAVTVETSFPFGFIRKFLEIPSEGETIVYPALRPIDSWLGVDRWKSGDYLSNFKGVSSNPYGTRPFVDGDSARYIHWKSSARRGAWIVKEFEREKRLRVRVDVRLAPKPQSEPLSREAAVSTAASLILELSRRGFEVLLGINRAPVEANGRSYLDSYLSALALAEPPSPEISARLPSWNPTEDSSVVVTDLPSPSVEGEHALVISRERLLSV